jgi:glutathione peroxidase
MAKEGIGEIEMIRILALVTVLCFFANVQASDCPAVLDSDLTKLNSTESVSLCDNYKGDVILFVNTASSCGFTPQLEGLEALYQEYKDQGFTVLGFPSDDFHQEHDDAAETAKVCYMNYGVTFPMFATSAVRGDDVNSVYSVLREQSNTQPKWNFYKYLVGRDGEVKEVFASTTGPDSEALREAIEVEL